MRLGLGSYAFRWAMGIGTPSPAALGSVPDLIRETADLGCEVLQLADLDALESASAAELTDLRAHAASAGVALQTGLTGATVERLTDHLRIATSLGADLARVVLHGRGIEDEREAARALTRLAPDYEAAGVTLAIENHFLTSSASLVELVAEIDSRAVGLTVDVANSIACQEWPDQTIAALAPFVRCLHLKDYRIEPSPDGVGAAVIGAPLAQGWSDIAAIVEEIAPHAPEGMAVILEQWSPAGSSLQDAITTETRWRRESAMTARSHPALNPLWSTGGTRAAV
ncbi:sugar phosphate isomerase/epimerase family protein [Bogoriella caseilytica]|uniref:Sugar phosphate isomerase/epimerase n=1 Tax=Bogoriella caseilytica TaxID=56055 RepID=A0A3N2BDW9_9MICO|nr:sugar phosphate isomerase/epimerase [Bogoriella caseilytica]ROR73450.1 sugar phosphate isomerase/epimerase [Bogoriella caseilytica]